MTQPPLDVNQSVVVLKRERRRGEEKNRKKLKKRRKGNWILGKGEEDGNKEEVALPTFSNRQDQYTFISPVTPRGRLID
jgi:hypothetical protein